MSTDSSNKTDLSVKIGNRLVTPALPIVDSSPPSAEDISFNDILSKYISTNIALESNIGIQTRERVLDKLSSLCRDWIESVCRKQGLPTDVIKAAGGQIFTSGSYRLGVHEPGADIDTIVVVPNMCSRDDFFGTTNRYNNSNMDQQEYDMYRDPESLSERIRAHADVTNFRAVEGAAVPIITFDWECINIDLLFARINTSSVVPSQFDIDDDAVLDGVDSATEKSLNGPRVTNLIAALVSGTEERYQSFLTVVRCVRKWAKARGIYSNKLGYWGGVNINIAVALVIQLYPNAAPASLLRRFFLLFKSWRWPNPIMLTKPHDASLGLQIWSAYGGMSLRQVAPMITPAYPAMNSSLSVSRQTLQILHEEICRGYNVVDAIWKKSKQQEQNATTDEVEELSTLFHELFSPSDFFISYPYYLSMCMVASTQNDLQIWVGFVESRLRKLVSDMLGKSLPLSKIQLWSKSLAICCADATSLITVNQRKNCITYFIGFQVDTLRMRGNQLNIEQQLQHFKDYELSRFSGYLSGNMDIFIRYYKVNAMPRIVFEGMYAGGKSEAMHKKKILRESDPKVIEAKRKAKLAQLKAKMEKLQSKAQEKQQDAATNAAAATDQEEEQPLSDIPDQVVSATIPNNDDEAILLENALDNIQSSNVGISTKTREEAELDRRKLLAGELLVEGGGVDDDYNDNANEQSTIEPNPNDTNIQEDEQGSQQQELSKEKQDSKPDHVKSKQNLELVLQPELQALRQAGYTFISSDEDDNNDDDQNSSSDTDAVKPEPIISFSAYYNHNTTISTTKNHKRNNNNLLLPPKKHRQLPNITQISFCQKFDVVELDDAGNVIDKGDDDFIPSKKWNGRKGGFEFKLGERGLGYYRTGKKVIVPSNIAY